MTDGVRIFPIRIVPIGILPIQTFFLPEKFFLPHIVPTRHSSYDTLFLPDILPTTHCSYLTFFLPHIFPTRHFSYPEFFLSGIFPTRNFSYPKFFLSGKGTVVGLIIGKRQSMYIPIWLHLRIIVKVIPYFLTGHFQKCLKFWHFAKKLQFWKFSWNF